MTTELSPDTQAALLLTAPLLMGSGASPAETLTPGEYKCLYHRLCEMHYQLSDLLGPDAPNIINNCEPVLDGGRLRRLLERGFLLSQAVESWQTRALWVVSLSDDHYPDPIKTRLQDNAPAVLYGCGDIPLLETGGLAVVGSRHVDESLIAYTMGIGRLAAQAGCTIVSGGARGIDQAAMRGALEAGGHFLVAHFVERFDEPGPGRANCPIRGHHLVGDAGDRAARRHWHTACWRIG